jgi:hypothetical protein
MLATTATIGKGCVTVTEPPPTLRDQAHGFPF